MATARPELAHGWISSTKWRPKQPIWAGKGCGIADLAAFPRAMRGKATLFGQQCHLRGWLRQNTEEFIDLLQVTDYHDDQRLQKHAIAVHNGMPSPTFAGLGRHRQTVYQFD